jgi:tRNA dimethylallyltransferase
MTVIAGGTNFYIRALLEGLFPAPPRNASIGARLAGEWRKDPLALFRRLEEIDDEAARRIGPNDRQRIIRALEVYELTGEALTSHWRRHEAPARYSPLLVAPQRSRSELYARIDARVERLFASGLVEEVERILASNVPDDAHAFRAIGYRQVVDMLRGSCDLEAAIEDTKRASRKFAKRQLTWLRSLREGTLQWVPPVEDGGAAAVTRLWEKHTEKRRET